MDLFSTIVQVSLALFYFIWKSDVCDIYICSYSSGATLWILTQVFWLAAGCFTRCMREGRYERRDEIRAEKEAKVDAKKCKDAEDELAKKKAELDAKEAELPARAEGGEIREQPQSP